MQIKDKIDVIRRSFREFLALPSLIILLFLLMAVGAYLFEHSQFQLYPPVRSFLERRVFADAQATSELLGTIAGSIITVTSITITLMLLILQQTATNLSTQVFDQFLRRRSNQLYFGFFIGLALYTLITLATVDEPFNPIFSATLAYLMTVVALYLLIVLFYSTIHQMRPPVIIQAIHNHTLAGRERQKKLIQRTRRKSQFNGQETVPVLAKYNGFVTRIDLSKLSAVVKEFDRTCEIVLMVSMGSFVAYHDVIAELKLTHQNGNEQIEEMVRSAIYLERSRDLENDPEYGIAQLENIGWTVTSTAKSNPNPGLHVVYSLRDLLARWSADGPLEQDDDPLPVVYYDNLIEGLLAAFESLAVVASASKEHQILAEILQALSIQYHRLPDEWLPAVDEAIVRIIATIDWHILTRALENAAGDMAERLDQAGKFALAEQIRARVVHAKNSR